MLQTLETDTRTRIVATAERFFREIGYQKTTVADIAKALAMSPANVYRFFSSKKEINEAVAERLTGEVRVRLEAAARGDGPVAARMRELLLTLHLSNCQFAVSEARMQEMVAVAMSENWQVIRAHIEKIDTIIAELVREGVEAGEFAVADAGVTAPCVRAAMIRFCHPSLIAQCADMPRPAIEEQIDFIMAGLGAGKTAAAARR